MSPHKPYIAKSYTFWATFLSPTVSTIDLASANLIRLGPKSAVLCELVPLLENTKQKIVNLLMQTASQWHDCRVSVN